MKIIIDTLASPRDSGGMRLHNQELTAAWIERFPQDEIVVVGGSWIDEIPGVTRHGVRRLHWPNDNFISRIVGELLVVPLLQRATSSGVLLSLGPVLSPLVRRRTSFAVSHDWRHLKHPEQFSRAQLLFRRVWRQSMLRAATVFAISEKTYDELRTVAPEARVVVVRNGGDHPRRWHIVDHGSEHVPSTSNEFHLVTFGHHNHKRPDLAIRALAKLVVASEVGWQLTVLGANGTFRDSLSDLARSMGVGERCNFPGFVGQHEYAEIISSADAVLLLAKDEGFGLPVVEAQYFGKPAVVTQDSGLDSVHDGIVVVKPNPADLAAALERVRSENDTRDAVKILTWADAADAVRAEVVLSLAASTSAHGV